MKVLLLKDDTIAIDLNRCTEVLNNICETLEFGLVENAINFGSFTSNVDYEKEIELLSKSLKDIRRDYVIYVTNRKYPDNWFWHSQRNVMILSFYGWQHYTNLPLENGLFYFICDSFVQRIDRTSRHWETTGCIYDFLGNKTAVDTGMKRGYICEKCLERIMEKTKNSKLFESVLVDILEILKSLSNASILGKNVLELLKKNKIPGLNWSTFEDEISQIYRELGAVVKQDVNLAGFQIDILVEETTPSKQKIRSAIECKYFTNKVGNKIVNDFSRIVKTLKDLGKIDKGVIVAYSGFSQFAYTVSKNTGIDLLKYADLKQNLKQNKKMLVKHEEKDVVSQLNEKVKEIKNRKERLPKIFVIMPFSEDLDDLYHLGILETARELNCSCERVDQIEYTGMIMEKIYESISNAEVVVAEVTKSNPNVYYELGYSHALKKPTIILTKSIESAPFDLQGYNHLIYNKIIDVKPKLKARLKALLNQPI